MGKRRFRMIAGNPLNQPSKDTEPALEELQKIYDMRSLIPGRNIADAGVPLWLAIIPKRHGRLEEYNIGPSKGPAANCAQPNDIAFELS